MELIKALFDYFRRCKHHWVEDRTSPQSEIEMRTCSKCGISEIGFKYRTNGQIK